MSHFSSQYYEFIFRIVPVQTMGTFAHENTTIRLILELVLCIKTIFISKLRARGDFRHRFFDCSTRSTAIIRSETVERFVTEVTETKWRTTRAESRIVLMQNNFNVVVLAFISHVFDRHSQ